MAVIKQADLERVGRDAVVLNLGDLAAQGERIKAMARAEAAAIIEAAKRERERLISDAREVGREEGRRLGSEQGSKEGRERAEAAALKEARERFARLDESWSKALQMFQQERDAMLQAARSDVLRLAILATEKITKRRLEVAPQLVEDQLAAVLAEVAEGTAMIVKVCAEDEAAARNVLPGLLSRFSGRAHAELVCDPALPRGSCVVEMSGGGMIDASIATQLERIAEALLPGAPEATP